MKILVCLLGYHQMPDQLIAHAVKPDRLIMVTTQALGQKGAAPMLLQSLALAGLDYSGRHEVIGLDEENSVSAIEDALLPVYGRYPGADWTVNITGGTKPMSIGACEFFLVRNARVLYVPFTDPREALDFSGGPPLDLSHRISIAEFLAGYGFDILNRGALVRAAGRAGRLLTLAATIASRCEDGRMTGCLDRIRALSASQGGRDEGMTFGWEDGVSLEDDQIREGIARAFGLQSDGIYLKGHLDKYAVQFLTGGWLEVFIWGLLKGLVDREMDPQRGREMSREAGGEIWDLQIGVWFGKKGQPALLQNEWDVAFMRDQSLCTVECKTGEQENDPTGNDTLYRIEAVKSQLGAVRVRSYLVTTAPNVLDPESGRVKERLLIRASLYDCSIITGETIRELAGLYLSGDPNLSDRVREVFDMRQGEGVEKGMNEAGR